MGSSFSVLVSMALRNLVSHRLKAAIVGGLIFFGTFLVVVGTSLLDTIERSMAKSITSSLAGQLQVYSKTARDKLALFGGTFLGTEDLGRIDDFDALRVVAESVPNIAAVVPMGLDTAGVTGGNEIDRLALELRHAVQEADWARVAIIRQQLGVIARQTRNDLAASIEVASNQAELRGQLADLDRLEGDAIWDALHTAPEPSFQFIESRIAPLVTDGLLIYLRYVGTDVEKFRKNFDRFQLVKGEEIPAGHRGFLFNDKFYEDQIKHKVARDLDRLQRERVENAKRIDQDPLLRSIATQLPRLQRRITFQLEPAERQMLETKLSAFLTPTRTSTAVPRDLEGLVTEFLTVNDDNLLERHAFFYKEIAPLVELYQVKVGDVMTISAFTRNGTLKSINVKVYGTFKFQGLERSDLAGGHNLMDMMSFRDLYDLMTDAKRKEMAQIRAGIKARDVDRGSAEAELFGGGGAIESDDAKVAGFDEFQGRTGSVERARPDELLAQVFDQHAIDEGVALNAAIILRDPSRLEESKVALQAALDAAKLNLQVIDWQVAAGLIGQFIYLVRGVLIIAIFIIFLVALVIINNTMVMATMDRVTEIGTLRAIGAQRSFIMAMFLVETLVLGMVAGVLGAFAGAGLVTWLGQVGISSANQDILIFLFAGPRLYPSVMPSNLVVAFVVVVLVSIASTVYPARLATRIQPVVAMQAKE